MKQEKDETIRKMEGSFRSLEDPFYPFEDGRMKLLGRLIISCIL